MQRFLSAPLTQAVLGALGKGFVLACVAYGFLLIKHVSDRQTVEGIVIVVFFYPTTVLLHLVLPTIPGLPAFLRRPQSDPVYHAPSHNDERGR